MVRGSREGPMKCLNLQYIEGKVNSVCYLGGHMIDIRMILGFGAWMTERMELLPTTIWNVINGADTTGG